MTEFFFFNDTATTEIYTLSLHDALPISADAGTSAGSSSSSGISGTSGPAISGATGSRVTVASARGFLAGAAGTRGSSAADRKSTRLNSSHANISYAVFCLKKKNRQITNI